MIKVYLAGAMSSRVIQDVLTERFEAAAACNHAGLDWYDPAESEGLERLDPAHDIPINYDRKTMAAFVRKDEAALDKCDVLLNLTADRASDGTAWEMARAYYKLHIPIVLVSPARVAGKLTNFSSIKADAVFATVEEAARYIARRYYKRRQNAAIPLDH